MKEDIDPHSGSLRLPEVYKALAKKIIHPYLTGLAIQGLDSSNILTITRIIWVFAQPSPTWLPHCSWFCFWGLGKQLSIHNPDHSPFSAPTNRSIRNKVNATWQPMYYLLGGKKSLGIFGEKNSYWDAGQHLGKAFMRWIKSPCKLFTWCRSSFKWQQTAHDGETINKPQICCSSFIFIIVLTLQGCH